MLRVSVGRWAGCTGCRSRQVGCDDRPIGGGRFAGGRPDLPVVGGHHEQTAFASGLEGYDRLLDGERQKRFEGRGGTGFEDRERGAAAARVGGLLDNDQPVLRAGKCRLLAVWQRGLVGREQAAGGRIVPAKPAPDRE